MRKNLLNDIRFRIGRDIEIFCRQSPHHIANTTAGEVRNMPVVAQTFRDFPRSLLHGQCFHRQGRFTEPPVLISIRERAIEVNRPCLKRSGVAALSSPFGTNE